MGEHVTHFVKISVHPSTWFRIAVYPERERERERERVKFDAQNLFISKWKWYPFFG